MIPLVPSAFGGCQDTFKSADEGEKHPTDSGGLVGSEREMVEINILIMNVIEPNLTRVFLYEINKNAST